MDRESLVGGPGANGASALSDLDQSLVEQVRQLVAERQARRDQLQTELAEMALDLRKYERILKELTGETPEKRSGPGRPRGQLARSVPSKVGPEKLAQIREAIMTIARDHDEFRQIDIRAMLPGVSSSVSASAFAEFRKEPDALIRLSRQEGNNKYFKLTREGRRELEQT